MTLKLRRAVSSDFKAPDDNGNLRYLFGKLYAVKTDEGFVFLEFRNTKLHHEEFARRFTEGLVYVVENGGQFGIVKADGHENN